MTGSALYWEVVVGAREGEGEVVVGAGEGEGEGEGEGGVETWAIAYITAHVEIKIQQPPPIIIAALLIII
jgi:hypothetical protein